MPSKFQFVTELYEKTLLALTEKAENWTGFLRAACYNYKCPFDEQVLIYAQRPDATAVLELNKWNNQFGRWINRGARGIAVFSDDNGKGTLKYYFDVSDTHASRYSRPLPIWKMEQRYEGEVIEALENTFGELKEKDTLVSAVFSASRNAASDNIPDYLHDMKNCVENSFLEELDELNIEVRFRQLIETSVAYMLLTRLSIDADEYIAREDFENLYDFNTLSTINSLGIATSDIAEMGLREISRTIMSLSKEQFFENNGRVPYDSAKEKTKADDERSSDYGNDLQNRGRLQDAQSPDAAAAGSASWQVRPASQTVSDEAPESALHEPQDDRQADGAFGRDRESGNGDDRADHLEDGADRRRDGEFKKDRPDEVDRTHEQFPAFSGGNGPERSDLQLNTTDEAGGENALPAFLNERLIQAIVLDDSGRTVTRQEIFGYFQNHRDNTERCDFLKSAYNDAYTEILVDETRIGYEKQENGLLMWEGAYLSHVSESVFSWAVITEITENLITRGEYEIRLGLQNMPNVSEQLALFDMGGDIQVYEIDARAPGLSLFPNREIAQEVIDSALFTAGNQSDSALRIVVQYMYERPEDDNVAFLRREFGTDNGRGIEYDGHRYAVWFTDDGMRFAEGNSVRTGRSRKTVSWADCSSRILELLHEGKYVSQNELDSAYEAVLSSCADGLIFIARDLSDEGEAQNLFPIVRSIYEQHMGFPDCSENLAAYMRNESGPTDIAAEYREFQKAYALNPKVSRFRVSSYNTHRIELILGEIEYQKREFAAQPDFIRQCNMFISQDEIEQYFLSDSKDSRLAIYAHFCNHDDLKEKQAFLKSEYGSYSGSCHDGYSNTKSSKGLFYERSYGRKNYESVTPKDGGIECWKRLEALPLYREDPKSILLIPFNGQNLFDRLGQAGIDLGVTIPIIPSVMYDGIIEIFKARVLDHHAPSSTQKNNKIVSQPYCVLLVEDNKTNQFIAKTILEQAGFRVLVAENGQGGYDSFVLHRGIIDLILMDLHMPVMNGYDSTTLIRKLDIEIPIVAMTADAIAGVEDRCSSIGINHFVSKPFDPDKFISDIVVIAISSGRLPKALQSGIVIEQNSEATSEELPAKEEVGRPEPKVCSFFSEEDGLRLLGGNVALYHTVLREYRTENAGLIAELSSQIESGSFSEAAKTIHKVKSSSGNIGAKSLYMVASKLQKALESGNPEVDALFEEFRQTFEQVMLYISKLDE